MKGSILMDNISVPIFILIIGIFIISSYMILDDLGNDQTFKNNAGSTEAFKQGKIMYSQMDYVSLILILIFGFTLLISAILIKSHPAFFVIMFLINLSVWVYFGVISNTYDAFISDADVSATASNFPLTNTIMSNLPLIMLVISVLIGVLMYVRGNNT